jgi:hypothetical protein
MLDEKDVQNLNKQANSYLESNDDADDKRDISLITDELRVRLEGATLEKYLSTKVWQKS